MINKNGRKGNRDTTCIKEGEMDIEDIKRYRGDIFASEYLDRIAALEAELHKYKCAFEDTAEELAECKVKLKGWVNWFEKTGDGSMAGLSDSEYHEALTKWIAEGDSLSKEGGWYL